MAHTGFGLDVESTQRLRDIERFALCSDSFSIFTLLHMLTPSLSSITHLASYTALSCQICFSTTAHWQFLLLAMSSRLSVYGGSEADRVGHTASMLDSTLYQSGHCEVSGGWGWRWGCVYGQLSVLWVYAYHGVLCVCTSVHKCVCVLIHTYMFITYA